MNFLALRERAAQLAFQAGLETVAPAPNWGTVVNLSLEEFSWEGEYVVTVDTVTLVIGQSTYALPLITSAAPWKRVTDALLGTSTGSPNLIMTDPQQLRRENPNWFLADRATPTRFYMPSPGNIAFYPTPVAVDTVTVRGYRGDGPLLTDTDSPACPAHFHEGIALDAAWRVCKQFVKGDDLERANGYRAESLAMRKALAQFLSEENGATFQRRVQRQAAERIQFGGRRWTR